MLIKTKDDQSAQLKELELRAVGAGPAAKQAANELRIRKAGLKGETESAYLIDFHFGGSPNWAVIHDLRLEHRGRTAQIDHLLINHWLDLYVLESKHFNAGLKIDDGGEFLRWDDYRKTYTGMASPLEQNERHIDVLRDVAGSIDWPQRLGLRISPTFHSLILIAPAARIDRSKRFDSSRVIKADQLKKRIDKDIDSENPLVTLFKTTAKIVSGETVEFVARQLVAQHRPLTRNQGVEPAATVSQAQGRTRIEPTIAPMPAPSPSPSPSPSPAPAPAPSSMDETTNVACKTCGQKAGEILYGKYGYYFKCDGCAGNTTIRLTCRPGHKPRLRKDGVAFYRECADCRSSALYHRNRA
ncbi:nuclease-related domain-containing protein [Lysobacter sp. CA199]|uniref:nuclease-related domain-containing protein n=1 Tax=Lysobacter sp. CA199 TaxID=3455608 RepID=UPI003F8CF4A9